MKHLQKSLMKLAVMNNFNYNPRFHEGFKPKTFEFQALHPIHSSEQIHFVVVVFFVYRKVSYSLNPIINFDIYRINSKTKNVFLGHYIKVV